jgi:hypothetical protein
MKTIKLTSAFVLLAIGIEELVRWFIICNKDLSFEAAKAEYSKALPSFLQNTTVHTFVQMGFFIGAGLLFMSLIKEPSLKLFAKILTVLSFVLAFWMLFSLM